MYCVIVQFDALPAQREAFRALALRHAAESLRDEPGTLLFRIVQDEERPGRFYAVEGYADRAANDAHRRGPILARNGPAIMPLLAAAPCRWAGAARGMPRRGRADAKPTGRSGSGSRNPGCPPTPA